MESTVTNNVTINGDNGNKKDSRKKFCFSVMSAKDIQQSEKEQPKFLVDGLISPGLNLLAAPRKKGKSWLALDIALSVARGENFWGRRTEQGKVLYFALEDSDNRVKNRMNKQLEYEDAPENLLVCCSTGYTRNGFYKSLDAYLDENTDIKLVIIDVLQKIRPDKKMNQSEYDRDYDDLGGLKQIADKHGISLLAITHTRKTRDSRDRLNEISGGVGVTGVADTILMISGDGNPSTKENKLYITGRDVQEEELMIRFDRDICRWKCVGSEEDFLIRQEEDMYVSSPIVKTVTALLEQNHGSWTGTSTELLECGLQVTGAPIAKSESALARKINGLDPLFEKNGILHQRPNPNGGISGRKHIFSLLGGVEDVPKSEGVAD